MTRTPTQRTVPQIVADTLNQYARGQVVTRLPSEDKRLIRAALNGSPDVLPLLGETKEATR